jgi:hypothetical protein
MNIFLTDDLRETETLENAKFIDIDDVEAFIKYCDNNGIISEGVKNRGVYYWKGIEGLWEKVRDEDIELFEIMATSGYKAIKNLYISADFKVLKRDYLDNVESEMIKYKIINVGEEEERGYFKKNDKGKWKRRLVPEEIAILSKINDKEKGNVFKRTIKDKYNDF